MPTNVSIVFYSMYGHIYKMAQAVEQGARSVPDTQVSLFQVKETFPDEVLAKMGALEAKKAWAHVPVILANQLADADAIIFGIPTRFGLVVSPMQTLFDATGQLWLAGKLVGKLGSVFTSTGTQHGGQETTIVHAHTFLYHQGMVVVGVPYACQNLLNMNEITGGSPYGASTMAGVDGKRQPTENELTIARYQGKHVAEIAGRLKRGAAGG
ncbi:MAG TPA: NAD(P)H:quinone oxidoreductase [Tepidisphaeraceae bacterium]|jgi:NAD(P)H dehydrogenase (quinone)